jgi:molybdopterin synthase sulfur carrier subunit
MTTTIQLLAFGGTKNIVGVSRSQFPIDASCSAGELLDALCRRYPALAPQRQVLRLAVNGAYVTLDARVAPNDEVALIPPVAGG